MAREKDDGDDIESLLAEAERTLAGGTARPPARHDERPVERAGRVRTAAVSAVVAGGAVWVLFAVLPFLRAGSGAVGAFLATFAVLLVLGGRRR